MQSQTSRSFAQSYILALKVRSKLTKQATDPKTSLRALVTQANMLDNLMDHIASETTKRNQKMNSVVIEDSNSKRREKNVTISLPDRRDQNTSIAEYEVDSDSDSDFDSDSDSESDYYYSSEEEADDEDISDEDESTQLQQLTNIRRSSRETSLVSQVFPTRENHTAPLSVIVEEMDNEQDADEEEVDESVENHGLPGLCRSHSLTDEEDFEQSNYVFETNPREHYTPRYIDAKDMEVNQVHIHDDVHTHHRSNAMVLGVY